MPSSTDAIGDVDVLLPVHAAPEVLRTRGVPYAYTRACCLCALHSWLPLP